MSKNILDYFSKQTGNNATTKESIQKLPKILESLHPKSSSSPPQINIPPLPKIPTIHAQNDKSSIPSPIKAPRKINVTPFAENEPFKSDPTISSVENDSAVSFSGFVKPSSSNNSRLIIYTDGGALNNGKRGARASWGVYIPNNTPFNIPKQEYFAELKCHAPTNQKGELMAILKALTIVNRYVNKSPAIHICIRSDSQYSIQCVTTWYKSWIKNDWKTKNGPVQNREIIEDILGVQSKLQSLGHTITYEKVLGHSGDVGNDKADELCGRAFTGQSFDIQH